MLPAHATPSRTDENEELARQLTGLPFPMMTEDLIEVGLRLLLPGRVLGQLDHLPLHQRFSSAADVADFVARGPQPAPTLRGA